MYRFAQFLKKGPPLRWRGNAKGRVHRDLPSLCNHNLHSHSCLVVLRATTAVVRRLRVTAVAMGGTTTGMSGLCVCTAAMRGASIGMRDCGVRAIVRGSIGMHDCGVRGAAIMRRSGVVRGRVPTRIGGTSASGISMSAVIVTASGALETMASPTVVVSPVFPRSNPQEDAIIKISWSVITGGGAGVGRIAIVAIRTDRRRTYIDCHLRIRLWNQGQGRKQSCCQQQKF
jgi:hypothetical protein